LCCFFIQQILQRIIDLVKLSITVSPVFQLAICNGKNSSRVSFAFDDCEVTEVIVSITSAAGVLLEEGPAVMIRLEGAKWIYTATLNNPALPGTKIRAACKHRPKNEGFMEVTLLFLPLPGP